MMIGYGVVLHLSCGAASCRERYLDEAYCRFSSTLKCLSAKKCKFYYYTGL